MESVANICASCNLPQNGGYRYWGDLDDPLSFKNLLSDVMSLENDGGDLEIPWKICTPAGINAGMNLIFC